MVKNLVLLSVERIAQKTPIPCFGSEYSPTDKTCAACPHKKECVKASGKRAGRIPLSKARFNLMPPLLAKKFEEENPFPAAVDRDTFVSTFYACWEQVTGRETEVSHTLVASVKSDVEKRSEKLGCSVRTYIMTNLLGFSESNPDRDFRVSWFSSDSAERRVDVYRTAAIKMLAGFSEEAVETLLSRDTESLEDRMLRSEIIAGKWIIGHKVRMGGSPLTSLYERKELELDPIWLAIEPTYKTIIFDDHLADPFGTKVIRTHRHSVAQVLHHLKTSKVRQHANARFAFTSRQKIMKKALVTVLNDFGFDPDDFEVAGKPITDATKMWSRLGLAVQHSYCLRLYDGDERIVRQLRSQNAVL